MSLNVAKNLKKALDLLGPNGENWVRGWGLPGGATCMVGAVNRVIQGRFGDDMTNCPETDALCKSAKESGFGYATTASGLVGLNDKPNTTFKNVRRIFQDAIFSEIHN